jgi:hypothetical protein
MESYGEIKTGFFIDAKDTKEIRLLLTYKETFEQIQIEEI